MWRVVASRISTVYQLQRNIVLQLNPDFGWLLLVIRLQVWKQDNWLGFLQTTHRRDRLYLSGVWKYTLRNLQVQQKTDEPIETIIRKQIWTLLPIKRVLYNRLLFILYIYV
jgi:hypothetical protein